MTIGDIFFVGPQLRFRLPGGEDLKTSCKTNTRYPHNFEYGGMATVLPDGGILLCGYQYGTPVKKECSKLLQGVWTPFASLNYNTQRSGPGGMSVTPHGVLVSLGDYNGNTEYYNETSNTWIHGPHLGNKPANDGDRASRRKDHCQITTISGKTFIIGGDGSYPRPSEDIILLSDDGKSWIPQSVSLSKKRERHTCIEHDKKIWIMVDNDVEIFDPIAMTVNDGPSTSTTNQRNCRQGVVYRAPGAAAATIYAICTNYLIKLKEDQTGWEQVGGRVYALAAWSRDFHRSLLVSDKICEPKATTTTTTAAATTTTTTTTTTTATTTASTSTTSTTAATTTARSTTKTITTTTITTATAATTTTTTTSTTIIGGIFFVGPQNRFQLPDGGDLKTSCKTNTMYPHNFEYGGMATVLPDGAILMCGYQYGGHQGDCSKLLQGVWTPFASLNYNTQRSGPGGMSVTPHGVLVSGDYNGNTEYYNETSSTWILGPHLGTHDGDRASRRKDHCQITTISGKTFIIGGVGSFPRPSEDIILLSDDGKSWIPQSVSLKKIREGHTCIEHDKKIWIMRYNDVEVFDPITMTINDGPSTLTASPHSSCNQGVVYMAPGAAAATIYAICNTDMIKLNEDQTGWEQMGRVSALSGWSRDYHRSLLASDKICEP